MNRKDFPNLQYAPRFLPPGGLRGRRHAQHRDHAPRPALHQHRRRARQPLTDYKALVCIFLARRQRLEQPDHSASATTSMPNYAAVRQNLALPQIASAAAASTIAPLNSDGHTYGLHPVVRDSRRSSAKAKLAVVFNVGPLLYPMTRAQYSATPCRSRRSSSRTATRSRTGRLRFPISRRRPAGADASRILFIRCSIRSSTASRRRTPRRSRSAPRSPARTPSRSATSSRNTMSRPAAR